MGLVLKKMTLRMQGQLLLQPIASVRQDAKKDSTHMSSKKHHHSSTGKHQSHKHHDEKNCKREYKSHKSSTKNPRATKEGFSASRSSDERPRQSASKNKVNKLQDDAKPACQGHKQGNTEIYPIQGAHRAKNAVTQSAPVMVALPAITRAAREQGTPSAMTPYVTRDVENPGVDGGFDVSYPGAYRERGPGDDYDEEDESLYDMEIGEALVSAYVVSNDETYYPPPPQDVAPRELVTRSTPPALHVPPRTMEAPRRTNETKQSLNITMPSGTNAHIRAPATSSVTRSNKGCCGHSCFVCGAISFGLIGAAGVALFFIFSLLGLWTVIPGIVFLILSCVFCCCLCSRGDTNVTAIFSKPQ